MVINMDDRERRAKREREREARLSDLLALDCRDFISGGGFLRLVIDACSSPWNLRATARS